MAQETLLSPDSAEEMLLTLSYPALVRKLGPLTAVGVVVDGTLAAALTVARLMDRGRIERSGLSAADLSSALAEYRGGARWTPAKSIERALEHAITVTGHPSHDRQGAEILRR